MTRTVEHFESFELYEHLLHQTIKKLQRRDESLVYRVIVEQIPSLTSNHANYNGPAGRKFRLQLVGPVAA